MAIRFDKEVWDRLLHRTKKTAAGAAEAAKTGAAIVGQKAEETLACAKLRASIRELKGRSTVSCVLWDRWCMPLTREVPPTAMSSSHPGAAGRPEPGSEGCPAELKILKGALFCDVCGAENAATNVYCQECGQPLSRP